jgi:hypothetical protein
VPARINDEVLGIAIKMIEFQQKSGPEDALRLPDWISID